MKKIIVLGILPIALISMEKMPSMSQLLMLSQTDKKQFHDVCKQNYDNVLHKIGKDALEEISSKVNNDDFFIFALSIYLAPLANMPSPELQRPNMIWKIVNDTFRITLNQGTKKEQTVSLTPAEATVLLSNNLKFK